jgi:hypothetical protein
VAPTRGQDQATGQVAEAKFLSYITPKLSHTTRYCDLLFFEPNINVNILRNLFGSNICNLLIWNASTLPRAPVGPPDAGGSTQGLPEREEGAP